MKRVIFLFSLILMGCGFPNAARAAEYRPARNTVSVKLGEHMAVEYERAVLPEMSVFVGPALFVGFASTDNVVRSELGFGGALGARFFITGVAPEGLFVGPVLNLGYSRTRVGAEITSGLRLSTGAMVGYTWIFFNVFDLSLGAGANYVNVTSLHDAPQAPRPFEASYRLALGVAF
jgi:hypothetical protein